MTALERHSRFVDEQVRGPFAVFRHEHRFFGLCMNLILRVTRTLIAPIPVHTSTDPSIFLHGLFPADSVIGIIPALSTYLVIAAGVILLIALVVGERRRNAAQPPAIS